MEGFLRARDTFELQRVDEQPARPRHVVGPDSSVARSARTHVDGRTRRVHRRRRCQRQRIRPRGQVRSLDRSHDPVAILTILGTRQRTDLGGEARRPVRSRCRSIRLRAHSSFRVKSELVVREQASLVSSRLTSSCLSKRVSMIRSASLRRPPEPRSPSTQALFIRRERFVPFSSARAESSADPLDLAKDWVRPPTVSSNNPMRSLSTEARALNRPSRRRVEDRNRLLWPPGRCGRSVVGLQVPWKVVVHEHVTELQVPALPAGFRRDKKLRAVVIAEARHRPILVGGLETTVEDMRRPRWRNMLSDVRLSFEELGEDDDLGIGFCLENLVQMFNERSRL